MAWFAVYCAAPWRSSVLPLFRSRRRAAREAARLKGLHPGNAYVVYRVTRKRKGMPRVS